MVEVEGWDVAARGGTHVKNTSEIGPMAVLGISDPGPDFVRVDYAVGPTAIQVQIHRRKSAERAASVMNTSVEELLKRATSLVQEKASLEEAIDQSHERSLQVRLSTVGDETVSRDGDDGLVGEVEGGGPNDVSERVRELVGDARNVIALTGVDGSSFLVVATTSIRMGAGSSTMLQRSSAAGAAAVRPSLRLVG